LLANSRPLEGFLFSIIPLCYLVLKACQAHFSTRCAIAIGALVATGCAALLWIGYYNFRVTGSAASFPETVHMAQYTSTPALLFLPLRPRAHAENIVSQIPDYTPEEESWRQARTGIGGYLAVQVDAAMGSWAFFLGPALSFGLLGICGVIKDKKLRLFVLAGAMIVILQLIETWYHPHYAAPGLGAIYVVLIASMRHIGTWRRTRRTGVMVVNAILLAVVMAAGVRYMVTPASIFPATWAGGRAPLGELTAELSKDAVSNYLSKIPGQHVVLVHYLSRHKLFVDWVSNGYDIPSQKIAWAHDGGSVNANLDLFCAFRDRRFWYIEPDEDKQLSEEQVNAVLRPISTEGKCTGK